MVSEAEGCAVLKRVFEARGYAIKEHIAFAEEAVEFEADGWDAGARVGYEYLTHEAGDAEDLPPESVKALEARMARGDLYFFLVDERQVDSPEMLAWAAEAFLDEVAARRATP